MSYVTKRKEMFGMTIAYNVERSKVHCCLIVVVFSQTFETDFDFDIL